MRITRIHINAVIGMCFQFILTILLITALFLLITEKVNVDGIKDIIVGALIPTIAITLNGLSDTVKTFAKIKDDND